MLVGLGGSGKQSLARVAASVNGTQFYQAGDSDMYSDSNFLEDIKTAFRVSGIKNMSSCFLLTNSSVKNISFLDYTNQYLVTGDIAGLWEKEDLESIEAGIRGAFREECRGNVHIESRLRSDQLLKC
jgi:dynein heavy chain